MMSVYKEARIAGVMALLVALGTGVEEVKASQTITVCLVRATQYHKTDDDCDRWTEKGQTSTQLRLPQCDTVVTNPHVIGNVALDPDKVPEGSLVYETQTGRFFVSTTGGSDVIDRTAAKQTADREGLPKEFRNALVFDFYYPREVVDNEFTHCWVISHESAIRFRDLKLAEQKKRLYASFWIERLTRIHDQITDKDEKSKLRVMISRLRENDRTMTRI